MTENKAKDYENKYLNRKFKESVMCLFSIGLLLLAKPLDRETIDQYRLIVTASDGRPGGVRLHPYDKMNTFTLTDSCSDSNTRSLHNLFSYLSYNIFYATFSCCFKCIFSQKQPQTKLEKTLYFYIIWYSFVFSFCIVITVKTSQGCSVMRLSAHLV